MCLWWGMDLVRRRGAGAGLEGRRRATQVTYPATYQSARPKHILGRAEGVRDSPLGGLANGLTC